MVSKSKTQPKLGEWFKWEVPGERGLPAIPGLSCARGPQPSVNVWQVCSA